MRRLIALLLFLLVPFANGSSEGAVQAIQAVQATMPSGSSMLLTAEEDVSLCESTIALQSPTRSWGQAKVVRFFRVFPAQYRIEDDRVVGVQVYLDSDPEWIVAILPEALAKPGGLVLSGLAEAEADRAFNRLVQYLELKIGSGEDALSLFDYWLRVARGKRVRRSVVSDRLSAFRAAAEKLRSDHGPKIGLAEFHKWQQAEAANLSALRPPVATVTRDFVVVRFWLFTVLVWERRLLPSPSMVG